jgi:hypothetical protein
MVPLVSHAKAADERAGHRTDVTTLQAGGGLVAPALPARLDKLPDELRQRWAEIWTSPVAKILDPVSDLEPMTRLFALYRRERQFDTALGNQLEWLSGSDDETAVFEPGLARIVMAVAAEIRQLEQTLGITPRGRLVIGAAIVAAGKAGQQQEGERDDADD